MAWAPDYITDDDLAAYMRIGDAVDDAELALAVTAASRAVDLQCNRQFGKVAAAEERFYTADYDYGRGAWWLSIDDLQVTTNFVLEVDGDAVTDYTLEPRNATAQNKPWTRLYFGEAAEYDPDGTHGQVGITAIWGWTAVPSAVKLATRLQASRFMARRDSPYGIAGTPEVGSEIRLLSRVDPDVAVALRGFARPRRAG
jgi:hypothetical protein